jgi:hypothetical protein
MEKLMPDPGQLRVQSFTPAVRAAERPAHAAEATVTCIDPKCGTVMRSLSCYGGCTDPDFC